MAEKVEYILSLKDLFTSKIKGAVNETEKLNKSVNGVQNSLKNSIGGLVAGAGIAAFAKNILDAGTQVEQLNVAFKTMLGSKEKADSLMKDMVTFAKTTPFELNEVATASKQLLAFGIEQENIISTMRSLGDVASGISAPIGDIAYLFGTIKTQGRAMTMDINQFANRGIPIWEELRKVTGLSGAALKKYVEDGKVDFNAIDTVFRNLSGSGGKFFNLMSEQAKTTGGQISNLKDQLFQMSVVLFNALKPAIDIVIKYLSSFISLVSSAITWILEWKKTIGFVTYALGALVAVIVAFNAYAFIANTVSLVQFVIGMWRFAASIEGVTIAQYALNLATAVFDALSGNYAALAAGAIVLAAGIWGIYEAQKSVNEETRKGSEFKGAFGGDLVSKVNGMANTIGQNPRANNGVKAVGASSGTKSSGTEISAVEAKGHQNFNISIDKLVEKLTIQTTNLKESGNAVKAEVTKALIGAVNDFQLMAVK